MSDITVTICNLETGQSESMSVSADNMSVQDLLEFGKALLGMDGNPAWTLVKDGHSVMQVPTQTLNQAGISNGDLLVIMKKQQQSQQQQQQQQRQAAAPVASSSSSGGGGGGGGLDFSNLLAGAAASSTTSTSSAVGGGVGGADAGGGASETPLYYNGMSLSDAVMSNPHPKAIVKILQQHEHLFKELNYHNPILAQKLKNQPYERAVIIWREDRVKGSISAAAAMTQNFHKEQQMTRRLQTNPNDVQAKEYFHSKQRKSEVQKQYIQAMQEYPESMGRVLMLYIEAKINNHSIQAFVDSGAQTTIMSKKSAQACGIFDLVDTRFAGVAVGVGTGKILGRIHIVQLQIGHVHFPCSVTIMDDATLPTAGNGIDNNDAFMTDEEKKKQPKPKEMEFLLGLDMLKRHLASIDLEQGELKLRLGPGQYLKTPFLHEKDLDESKGGTKGFNAEKSNQQILEAQRKFEEGENNNNNNNSGGGKGKKKDDTMEE